MTGIGENTLAQPVKPPLRERRACLAKLVKNRLTLTIRQMNKEQEALGRVVIRGRVRSDLFDARYFPEVDDASL